MTHEPIGELAGTASAGATSAKHPAAECRACGHELKHSLIDLGMSPLCQTHISEDQLNQMEPFYPLHARVCEHCFLVQLEEFVTPDEIFSEYAYFSSYSDSWVAHAKRYCEMMQQRFGLGSASQVVEIASNDGYLLQHFQQMGVPVLGVEPAANVAAVAEAKGIPSITRFFGAKTAAQLRAEYGLADLLLGNNVLAHVPNLNDFVTGMKSLLAPAGVITMEFPHLEKLMSQNQFDTIYHEHFSYFSFLSVERVFENHGLRVFDVQELPTHGGSLRIFARHVETEVHPINKRVESLRARELAVGFNTMQKYTNFGEKVMKTKRDILEFMINAKRQGKSIAGYGAPGKGNTLLNYCGIRTDFLDFTVDRNPYKQGKFTPGTRIPILSPDALTVRKPDYVLVLPWNLIDEIEDQCGFIRQWGGQFVVPIPAVTVR